MNLAPMTRKGTDPLARLHYEMDDLFDGFFRGLDRPFSGYQTWPLIDVAEHNDSFEVRAEVPGCKPEEIDISVYGNTLTISGAKQQGKEEKDKDYYHMESSHGSFRREIALPADVDSNKVEATYKDGVLSIKLPKAEVTRAVKVKVKQ